MTDLGHSDGARPAGHPGRRRRYVEGRSRAVRLPSRPGDPPLVSGPEPHEQVSQAAPVALQDRLVELVAALPGVAVGPSFVAVPGARAFHLPPQLARGPVAAFQAGTEFAHIHPPYDGSLHLTVPGRLKESAVEAGWGVPHPVTGVLLLYGPRDEPELAVAWSMLQASYRYAVAGEEEWPEPGCD
jgi:phospholipase/carboxylesterase